MDAQTKQAIDYFVEFTPKYINAPIHCTDRQRMFDIAIAAFHAQELLSDVADLLNKLIHENQFVHADDVAKTVIHDIGILVEFLKYQQSK